MDPKLMAKAKARAASVKGPPPLPVVDQERPTPRPPALAPERPTSRPAAIDEPPPTPRAPAVDAEPLTPRPVPVDAESADDEDEHTVMRPATAPLPRDAYRDDASQPLASDAEPSAGLPLELTVQEQGTRKSRAGLAWALLAAVVLGAGALVLLDQQQSATQGTSAAPVAAPKSFTRPPPAAAAGRPRDEGTLDPPISTSFESNEAVPEDEVVNTPSGVRRRPRPAIARPAPGNRPPATAAAATNPSDPPETTATTTAPAGSEAPAEPAPATAEPSRSAEATTASAILPTPPAAPVPPAAATGTPPAQGPAEELPKGNVDTENPYGE